MRLEGKVALVTGAARGIGAEIARVFAREGAKTVIADIMEAEAGKMAEKINAEGGTAMHVQLDVSDEESWKKVIARIDENYNAMHILVNNAGVSKRYPLEEYPVEEWERIMSVNVRGVFLGLKHSIPLIRRSGGGSIVNMSSVCGLVGHRTSNIAYITSKGGVNLLTKGTAVKHAAENIRVNAICPATVETELIANLSKEPEVYKSRVEEIPMGRMGSVTDIANAALFLASDESAFITGVALPVDGGLTAY